MPLDILVLADLRYPLPPVAGDPRHGHLARLFYRKALRKLRHEDITPGLVILVGDLLGDAGAPDAGHHLALLAEEILKDGAPVLAVPGHHDNPRLVAKLFHTAPGLHIVNGCGFLVFHDAPVHGQPLLFRRDGDGLALPGRAAREHPGMPLVAVQHPAPDFAIPGTPRLENHAEVLASYDAAGVLLTLSRHAREGLPPVSRRGPATRVTLPPLAEPPFSFLHVRVAGADATPTVHQLKLPGIPLADTHCHTAFAQCASGAAAAENQRLAEILGLQTLVLTEHAFQLYFPAPLSWSFKWMDDPRHARDAWQTPGRGRMAAYRNFIQTLRGENLLIGLELDLHDNGRLLLHPDDVPGWDLFLGAMHRIQGAARGMPPARVEFLFMRDLHALCAPPVHILAHPLRIFKTYNIPPPVHLYDDIAKHLAKTRVAAEINFHETPPDPVFCAACLRHGVKLSLGTDTHSPHYAADLHPHLRFLASLGVSPDDPARVYMPKHERLFP